MSTFECSKSDRDVLVAAMYNEVAEQMLPIARSFKKLLASVKVLAALSEGEDARFHTVTAITLQKMNDEFFEISGQMLTIIHRKQAELDTETTREKGTDNKDATDMSEAPGVNSSTPE